MNKTKPGKAVKGSGSLAPIEDAPMGRTLWLSGPWIIDGEFDDGVNIDITVPESHLAIAEVFPLDGEDLDSWGEESIARAHLIGAATELYAALEKYVEHFGDPLKCAAAALAHARGELLKDARCE